MNQYLSIVATTRNDNHGGDLLKRTTAFVTGIYDQAKKWDFPVELIIVEWNPPVGEKLLHEVLPKPYAQSNVTLKYIVVPKEVHQTYKNAGNIPLYQMIAKNVGIRRATGEYILCTNIDILFSDESFKFFADKKLENGIYYRANRCDIPKEVMNFETLSERLEYASSNIIKRLGKSQGHETLILPSIVYKFPRVTKLLNNLVLSLWKNFKNGQFPHFTVDFDACGDFTLMSRVDWEKIDGYPELDMYSIHIDSMGLWAANAMGIKQFILPYNAPIYHIYHEDGWESDDALRTIKFLESKPSLDYSIVYKGGIQIINNKQSWGFNTKNWGLIDVQLPEFEFPTVLVK
jgi:hypothetical protein